MAPTGSQASPTICIACARFGQYACGRGFARLPPRAKPPDSRRSPCGGPQLVERREDLGGVAFRLDLGPDPGDPTVGRDQERPAGRAPVGPAVVLLLDPRAV